MRRALSLLCGTVAYLAAWFLSTALPTRLLWHLPLEHRFTYEVRPLSLAADFYGRLLFCGGAFLLAYAAASLLPRLLRVEPRASWLRLLLFWSCGLFLFTSGLYLSLLIERRPMAAPLPPGYVAR